MIDTYSVPLKTLVEEFKLEIAFQSTDYESIRITVEDVARPGLQLAGCFEFVDSSRIELIGMGEYAYREKFDEETRAQKIEAFFALKPPVVIVARNLEIFPEMVECAKRYEVPLLRTIEATMMALASMVSVLATELAPRITRHGVFVEVYGVGILLRGESGVGKSGTAV